ERRPVGPAGAGAGGEQRGGSGGERARTGGGAESEAGAAAAPGTAGTPGPPATRGEGDPLPAGTVHLQAVRPAHGGDRLRLERTVGRGAGEVPRDGDQA